MWRLGVLSDEPGSPGLLSTETHQPESDRLAEPLRVGDTSWTLDLDDPYRWQDRPEPVDA